MEPIKIIIEIRGGSLTALLSNTALQYVVVDYDNINHGANPVSEPMEPDLVATDMNTCYNDPDPADREIQKELKRLKF